MTTLPVNGKTAMVNTIWTFIGLLFGQQKKNVTKYLDNRSGEKLT